MKLEQVSEHCYAVFNEKNRICDANSGLIALGEGLLVDTQSDLRHAREMMRLFGGVWNQTPAQVMLTHEDADRVWGNQLFKDAEIIAHRCVGERMKEHADPRKFEKLLKASKSLLGSTILRLLHPGVLVMARQLSEDYDFSDIDLTLPTRLFDDRLTLNLDGIPVELIHLEPSHQAGDAIVHVPSEGVVFAGDIVFCESTPIGWTGTFEN